MSTDVLEVHLEELGAHSWVRSLLNTVGGSHGSAQYRFVARPPGPDHGIRDHVLGATFPGIRAQDLKDQQHPNGWIELAEQELEALDRQLRADGWQRGPDHDRAWWARTYERPGS
jgi:hypothetical protein